MPLYPLACLTNYFKYALIIMVYIDDDSDLYCTIYIYGTADKNNGEL